MPVVTVHALEPPDPRSVRLCLEAVAEALAEAIGNDVGQVWVYWCAVERALIGGELREFHGHCPVITIRARQGRSQGEIAAGLQATARAAAAALDLPVDDIWIHWVELPVGRVMAGNAIH